jgi:hypothetical protein
LWKRAERVGTPNATLSGSALLNNQTYLGLAVHMGTAQPGEHAAIIDQDLRNKVHAILTENVRTRSANIRAQTPALLKGLIFDPQVPRRRRPTPTSDAAAPRSTRLAQVRNAHPGKHIEL